MTTKPASLNTKIIDFATIPNSQESEEAVIGAVHIDQAQFASISSFLKPEHFFYIRNGYVWEALEWLHKEGINFDVLTICKRLQDQNRLEEVGGQAYIISLISAAPNPQHARHYADIVERTAARRQLLEATDKIRKLAVDESTSFEQVAESAENLLSVATESVHQETSLSIVQAIHKHMDVVEVERAAPKQHGVPTGIVGLDDLIGGLRRDRLYYVGARTHMGKTSFMLSVGVNAARFGARVMIVSREETYEDLTSRILSLECGIEPDRLTTGNMNDAEYSRYVEVCGRVAQFKLIIDTPLSLTPRQLLSRIEAQQHRNGVDLVIVDYLQLISAGAFPAKTDYERLNYVSDALKKIAHRCRIPVMVGVQNNRESEKMGGNRRPQLADFKGTGNIEQDADVAILLYREAYYNSDAAFPEQAELIIPKNKVNGKRGTVFAHFHPVTNRFSDWTGQGAKGGKRND